jgi:hypothetical protein
MRIRIISSVFVIYVLIHKVIAEVRNRCLGH